MLVILPTAREGKQKRNIDRSFHSSLSFPYFSSVTILECEQRFNAEKKEDIFSPISQMKNVKELISLGTAGAYKHCGLPGAGSSLFVTCPGRTKKLVRSTNHLNFSNMIPLLIRFATHFLAKLSARLTLCIRIVVTPQRSNFVLTTDIPHGEGDVLILDRLNVEAWRRVITRSKDTSCVDNYCFLSAINCVCMQTSQR